MPQLTAIVFTYNRRDVVETTLRSARFADRLIVVDKGSTDGTAEIGKSYADEFHTAVWSPTIESTKAEYVPRVDSDWILMLDDDECLNRQGIEYAHVAAADSQFDVHYLPFRHYVLGRHDEQAYYWPEYRPALFRRGAIEFLPTVHGGTRVVTNKAVHVDPSTGVSIMHLSHPGSSGWLEKTNRYTDQRDRASNVTVQDLTPAGVIHLMEKWLRTASTAGDTYVTAVAALRGIYDVVDAIKLFEQQQPSSGDAIFQSICKDLQAEYDILGIERIRSSRVPT